jgi:HdeA/HdeB family protein
MKTSCKLVMSAAAVLAGLSLCPGSAQETKSRAIEQYTCKEVMREKGADRDVAIAFLHGFLLGKSGSSSIYLDILHKQTNDFIERCLDNPGEKALDAMNKVKG